MPNIPAFYPFYALVFISLILGSPWALKRFDRWRCDHRPRIYVNRAKVAQPGQDPGHIGMVASAKDPNAMPNTTKRMGRAEIFCEECDLEVALRHGRILEVR